MPLRIELAPNERLIIGNAAIRNGPRRTEFIIETKTKVLRERDIITERDADTPCKRLYFALEATYLADDPEPGEARFMAMAEEIMEAVPSTAPFIAAIFAALLAGEHYKALKRAQALVAHEKRLLAIANGSAEPTEAAELAGTGDPVPSQAD